MWAGSVINGKNERINATKTVFERFQKEHFLLLTTPEPAENESVFVAYTELYVCIEEMTIKPLARLRERAAAVSQIDKAMPSTSTQENKCGLSEREKDLAEREERIISLHNEIAQQRKIIDERADTVEKEEEMVLEVKERAKHETLELNERKMTLDKMEKELKKKQNDLCAQEYSLDDARDYDEKVRKEQQ